MRISLVLAAFAFILSGVAWAQGPAQIVHLAKVDVVKVSSGYRASKVIGSTVVNEANDTVGKVDDIILGRDDKSAFAVLSVGGFLGVGTRLVALPYEQLKSGDKNIVLSGASKDSLKALPEFKYAEK